MTDASTISRTRHAERFVEAFLALPLISEFVFRSPQIVDTTQKEVADLLVSQTGASILISLKCQEDPASRDLIKTTSWANKQAKKALNQLRGALRKQKGKAIWCDHARRGRVEFPGGLPKIDHGIVIVEVFARARLEPADVFPLEIDGVPVAYFSVNDFLNLAMELRTLPEIFEYLSQRRTLPIADLHVIGDEKTLFELYLLNNGSLEGCGSRAEARAKVAKQWNQVAAARAAKAESDRFSKLMEYVADQLATRNSDYASDLSPELLASFDGPAVRKQYMQMQEVLANLRLRERAVLGRAFEGVVQSLRGNKEGFTYRAIHFDSRPEWVFVLVSSKGVTRREVLERATCLTRAAMAHYRKSRCLLVVDRDGESFEVTMGIMNSPATDEEITAGRELFGRLKMTAQEYSFVPKA
jgi:hypothetical protein